MVGGLVVGGLVVGRGVTVAVLVTVASVVAVAVGRIGVSDGVTVLVDEGMRVAVPVLVGSSVTVALGVCVGVRVSLVEVGVGVGSSAEPDAVALAVIAGVAGVLGLPVGLGVSRRVTVAVAPNGGVDECVGTTVGVRVESVVVGLFAGVPVAFVDVSSADGVAVRLELCVAVDVAAAIFVPSTVTVALARAVARRVEVTDSSGSFVVEGTPLTASLLWGCAVFSLVAVGSSTVAVGVCASVTSVNKASGVSVGVDVSAKATLVGVVPTTGSIVVLPSLLSHEVTTFEMVSNVSCKGVVKSTATKKMAAIVPTTDIHVVGLDEKSQFRPDLRELELPWVFSGLAGCNWVEWLENSS